VNCAGGYFGLKGAERSGATKQGGEGKDRGVLTDKFFKNKNKKYKYTHILNK